ncbi:MAG: hypothetical protein JWN70_3322, partial [Planctomycetaceae bacterium]|nr:hypothetical protein [Planctomycetaceae bacterium]
MEFSYPRWEKTDRNGEAYHAA